jgi:hypothetical protein
VGEADVETLTNGRRLLGLLRAILVTSVAATVVALGFTPGFAGFVGFAVVGGIGICLALRVVGRVRRPPAAVPDRFARDAFSTDTLNFAHVRVSGFGGFALVLVAVAMAFDLERVGATLLTGLVGGSVAGVLLILYRRRRSPLGSSAKGPGARTVFFADPLPPRPAADPSAGLDRQVAVPTPV